VNKNIVKKSILYILISTISLIIIIPFLYLTTVSFSNTLEVNSYPKRLIPRFRETLVVEYNLDEEYYSISRKNASGSIETIYIVYDFEQTSKYLKDSLNLNVGKDKLKEDFLVAKETNEVIEVKYKKTIFNNYIKFFKVFSGSDKALFNSIKAALYTILISATFGGAIGYALARTKIKGKEAISMATLIVRMFPIVSISVPMAVLLIKYGMFDTMLGLAIIYSIPNIGLTAWITRSIFLSVNKELEEASLVFGANKRQTFIKITTPLVLPAFAASSMYAFITAWNDTAVALLLTDRNQTLALVIHKSMAGSSSSMHYAASGAILLILPALVFTFLLKDYINKLWG